MKFRSLKAYKYELTEALSLDVEEFGITPNLDIETPYIFLSTTGMLRISAGYATDGPSGPTIDTPDFMTAATAHDSLYQLMRLGLLLPEAYRPRADKMLYALCRRAGMGWFRARYVYLGVRMFGWLSTRRDKGLEPQDVVLESP